MSGDLSDVELLESQIKSDELLVNGTTTEIALATAASEARGGGLVKMSQKIEA